MKPDRRSPHENKCVVCNGDKQLRAEVIEGVRVIACKDCLGDQFRRPRALEFTLNGRPQ